MKIPPERRSEMCVVTEDTMAAVLASSPVAYTFCRREIASPGGDGVEWIVACAGIVRVCPWIGSAWAFVSANVSRRDILTFTRVVNDVLEESLRTTMHRIETSIPVGFDQGFKWARLLGLHREGLMRRYDPNGQDHWLYARVRNKE